MDLKNGKTQLFNSRGGVKWAYFQKKWSVPLNRFFLRKGMSHKYKLLYYLKRVYVGGFSHRSEQKLQTGLLKMHIHFIVCTLSGKI